MTKTNERMNQILTDLKNGKIHITQQDIWEMNNCCLMYLRNETDDIESIRIILEISNILYNNTSREVLPLEDGLYDLVVVKFNKETGNKAPVGASPVKLNTEDNVKTINVDLKQADTGLMTAITMPKDDMLYYDQIAHDEKPIPRDFMYIADNTIIDDIKRNTAHSDPSLVGTLHKCKFVTAAEAVEVGADKNESVMAFDRDFLYPTFPTALQIASSKNQYVTLIAELKYDGVSIEMQVKGDSVVSAISRGDTANDEASDFTPIFEGYKFQRAHNIEPDITFGIKFEAIITYENLSRIEEMFGKKYKNARVAIIGILGSKDARKYRDFITLVPIRTNLGFKDPVQEVEFLNKYYSNGVAMKYAVLSTSNFASLLFAVKSFKEEAEYMRSFLGFMYDGVVISYADPDVRRILGRQNSIDLWSIAIKFNALQKNTYFYGYKYTVGQDGRITPMAYFAPVEFNGSIHDKTTIHSFKRFKNLSLKVGDIVSVKYVNDVICYLTKPEITFNRDNPNPIIEFPEKCPICGAQLMQSDSGDSAFCPNIHCKGREISRVSNMLKKLNIKDFGRAYLNKLDITDLNSFLNLKKENLIPIIGEVMANKLMDRIHELITNPYPDYRLVGAIGFTSISSERWKYILSVIKLDSIINRTDEELGSMLRSVKGIGSTMAQTIVNERKFLINDLKTIASLPNVQYSYGSYINRDFPQVRFTGFRDKNLEEAFNEIGFDADGSKSVTKKTSILLIPHPGFTSTKISKIGPNCIIMTPDQAWEYIQNVKIQNKNHI